MGPSLLIEQNQFWVLAELLLTGRKRKLYEDADAYLRSDYTKRLLASAKKNAVRSVFYAEMSKLFSRVMRGLGWGRRLNDIQVPDHWTFEVAQGDDTWFAALAWFAANRPDFNFYQSVWPPNGIVCTLDDRAIFISTDDVERVWAMADRIAVQLRHQQVTVITPYDFKRITHSELIAQDEKQEGVFWRDFTDPDRETVLLKGLMGYVGRLAA